MIIKNFLTSLLKGALILWALVIIAIFMYFPGAISHMHRATLHEISMLPERLSTLPVGTFLGDFLLAFLGMTFFGIVSISLGSRFARLLHLDEIRGKDFDLDGWAYPATCFLIGNALLSFFFLTLSVLFGLSSTQSTFILSIGFLSGLTEIKKVLPPTITFKPTIGKSLTILSITILGATIFQSASHLSYDASAVYFSTAKLTAIQHHAGYYLENTFPVSVLHSTISYTIIMQLFGDQSARMLSWLFGIVNIIIAVALSELIGASSLSKRILPILILTSTAFLDQLGDGKVELFSSAYALIAIYWLIAHSKGTHHTQSSLFLSGFFIGFSCILRPYNVFLLGVFSIVYFLYQIGSKGFTALQASRSILWMILGSSGFAIFHFAINKTLLGSPFAFWASMVGINPDGPWDFNAKVIWIYRILYPFVVTFKNTGASLGNITPLVLVFSPVLILSNVRKHVTFQRNAGSLILPAVISLIAWVILFFAIVEVRYVLFLWIILFIPMAEIAARTLESADQLIKTIFLSTIFILIGFVLIRSVFLSIYTYSPVIKGDPQCFEDTVCGHFTSINQVAASGERVLTLSGYRYYLRTDLFACSTNHGEYKLLRESASQNSDQFWLEIYRQGYRYIAYEKGYTTDHVVLKLIPNPANTPGWMTLVPIFGNPGDLQIAYRIDVKYPPLEDRTICKKQETTGLWELQRATP